MDLKKIYEEFGGDYDDVLSRLFTDERICKFLKKFALNNDYDLFLEAINNENYEDAFRYSHNLKGISLNLGFSKLASSSSELCEYFRNGAPEADYSEILKQVEADRELILEAIKKLP